MNMCRVCGQGDHGVESNKSSSAILSFPFNVRKPHEERPIIPFPLHWFLMFPLHQFGGWTTIIVLCIINLNSDAFGHIKDKENENHRHA